LPLQRWYKAARKIERSLLLLALCFALRQAAQANVVSQSVSTEAIGLTGALDKLSLSTPPSTVTLTFALKSEAQQNAAEFISTLTDPSSIDYHKWLTAEQYGDKFGADRSDINAVLNYITTHGFTGIKLWRNHLFITAQTSKENAQSLFNVELHSYVRNKSEVARGYSATYYAPDKEPVVDAVIAIKLLGIFGLSNAPQHRPMLEQPESGGSDSTNAFNPLDLSQVYNASALHAAGFNGAGQTIAIFSPTRFRQSDVDAFLAANNITGTNISIVNVDGGTQDDSDSLEACLDIETAVGQAPGATIKVYEGPNDGSLNIFSQMADDDPSVVTESYGSDENSVDSAFAASYEMLRQEMAAEGISIIVASGDTGAYDAVNQSTVTVSLDASSAYVTSVGGTELSPLTDDQWDGEVAWTYNDGTLGTNSGSGGGLSMYYPQPLWQKGPGVANTFSNGMRQIPDISTLASNPYYNIFAYGSFAAYGGTSCGCQYMGGCIALIDQALGTKLGNVDSQLYEFGTSAIYHDITSGNNGLYDCTPGWDFVTGFGSPDIAKLALAFQGTSTAAVPIHTFTSGLQMISLPFAFQAPDSAGELLNGLVTPSGITAYQIATWEPSTFQYTLSPTSPAKLPSPGLGYWARFGSSGSLTAIGTPIGSSTYSVQLKEGWNIIGNPYESSISIGSLLLKTSTISIPFTTAITDGIIQPNLYDYDGTNYVAHGIGDMMQSYDGYWIYSTTNCTLTYTSP
jgi:subtilase family serine protease